MLDCMQPHYIDMSGTSSPICIGRVIGQSIPKTIKKEWGQSHEVKRRLPLTRNDGHKVCQTYFFCPIHLRVSLDS